MEIYPQQEVFEVIKESMIHNKFKIKIWEDQKKEADRMGHLERGLRIRSDIRHKKDELKNDSFILYYLKNYKMLPAQKIVL